MASLMTRDTFPPWTRLARRFKSFTSSDGSEIDSCVVPPGRFFIGTDDSTNVTVCRTDDPSGHAVQRSFATLAARCFGAPSAAPARMPAMRISTTLFAPTATASKTRAQLGVRLPCSSAMNEQEYLAHDATGLAELVSRREVTPAELLELAIARTESANPRLNAIVIRFDELARERARSPLSGPFAGVPFLLKDLHQEYEGVCS